MKDQRKTILLTGNEAIARGAYESGVKVAAAYPGTPSTEILENTAKYREIYSQWSVNEKVALEVASGASLAGSRTLVAMKHVGLNVAADPFMTMAYTGVNGGLVLVSADDPYLHSSQNEQDNRYYARFAKVPMLEPSDSQEAKDYVPAAFRISEEFDTPVILRTTTRISHSRSLVRPGRRTKPPLREYKKDSRKYVMIPAFGRVRHKLLIERWKKLEEYVEGSKLNKVYHPGAFRHDSPGIITSGICFQYAREVFGEVPIMKLGITSPLPVKAIRRFAENKKLIIVIEELEPYLEEQLLQLGLGLKIAGKEFFPRYGELTPGIIRDFHDQLFNTRLFTGAGPGGKMQFISQRNQAGAEGMDGVTGFKSGEYSRPVAGSASTGDSGLETGKKAEYPGGSTPVEKLTDIPNRPPVLCAGCPHRSVFYVLKKLKLHVMGDIGCYTLSVLPPLNCMDTTLCMGAGVGQALGMEKADDKLKGNVVSVIGDSTFFHSGITPLIDNVYNRGTGIIIILDNRITAMTGHQVHPGVGRTLMGEDTYMLKPEDIARAAGVKNVTVVDPYDLKLFEKTIKEQLKKRQLSVVIARRECILLDRNKKKTPVYIDQDLCKSCGLCLKFGCPAIELKDGKYVINEVLCTGCRVCINICKKSAIKLKSN